MTKKAKKPRSVKEPATKVLLAALPDIPFDGWTEDVLSRAAKKSGVTPTQQRKLFPRGVMDLIAAFSSWATHATLKKMTKAKIEKMRVRDRIAFGVRTRLEILTPHKQALSMALAYGALPPRHARLIKMLWQAADHIWRASGDRATDYNHYTKRFLLSGVISSTTLYWLNDDSANHEKTWAFLDRRIDNVLTVGKAIGKLKKRRA